MVEGAGDGAAGLGHHGARASSLMGIGGGLSGGIDDLRHFGHFDEDQWDEGTMVSGMAGGLAFTAKGVDDYTLRSLSSPSSPSPIMRRGVREVRAVKGLANDDEGSSLGGASGYGGRLSDLEYARGGGGFSPMYPSSSRNPSLLPPRDAARGGSYVPRPSAGLGAMMEAADDLPAFDEGAFDFGGAGDYSLSFGAPPPALATGASRRVQEGEEEEGEGYEAPPPPPPPPYEAYEGRGKEIGMDELAAAAEGLAPAASAGVNAGRGGKRVRVDEHIELSDRVIKQVNK